MRPDQEASAGEGRALKPVVLHSLSAGPAFAGRSPRRRLARPAGLPCVQLMASARTRRGSAQGAGPFLEVSTEHVTCLLSLSFHVSQEVLVPGGAWTNVFYLGSWVKVVFLLEEFIAVFS